MCLLLEQTVHRQGTFWKPRNTGVSREDGEIGEEWDQNNRKANFTMEIRQYSFNIHRMQNEVWQCTVCLCGAWFEPPALTYAIGTALSLSLSLHTRTFHIKMIVNIKTRNTEGAEVSFMVSWIWYTTVVRAMRWGKLPVYFHFKR